MYDGRGSGQHIAAQDLKEKTHQLPISCLLWTRFIVVMDFSLFQLLHFCCTLLSGVLFIVALTLTLSLTSTNCNHDLTSTYRNHGGGGQPVLSFEQCFIYFSFASCVNNMVKQLIFATRIPGHAQPVGHPCGTWMHNAMRDVKDMGQQMGYRSLE